MIAMSRFVVLLAALALLGLTSAGRVPQLDGRIVGGKDVDISQHPYQVSVRLFGSHTCGGSIIGEKLVLTAAHCIFSALGSYYSIQYGVTKIGGSQNVIEAASVVRHEKYDSSVIDFDVALIRLKSAIIYGPNAQPIQLAPASPGPGSDATVTGWGTTTEGGVTSSVLQAVTVQIVSNDACGLQYLDMNTITDRMLCAGVPQGGKDACQGDSGGPLVTNGVLSGIVSWGMGCARPDYSGVYSNVANLRSWIDANSA